MKCRTAPGLALRHAPSFCARRGLRKPQEPRAGHGRLSKLESPTCRRRIDPRIHGSFLIASETAQISAIRRDCQEASGKRRLRRPARTQNPRLRPDPGPASRCEAQAFSGDVRNRAGSARLRRKTLPRASARGRRRAAKFRLSQEMSGNRAGSAGLRRKTLLRASARGRRRAAKLRLSQEMSGNRAGSARLKRKTLPRADARGRVVTTCPQPFFSTFQNTGIATSTMPCRLFL